MRTPRLKSVPYSEIVESQPAAGRVRSPDSEFSGRITRRHLYDVDVQAERGGYTESPGKNETAPKNDRATDCWK